MKLSSIVDIFRLAHHRRHHHVKNMPVTPAARGSRGECPRRAAARRRPARGSIAFAALALLLVPWRTDAFPLNGDQTVLPAGTELYEEMLARPRELFHSEAIGGRKSSLSNLGDLAFNSPAILGGKARQAEISC